MRQRIVGWTDIPGFEGKYQAHPDGNIRRVFPSGKTSMMCAYYHERRGRTYGYRFVKLTKDGRSKEYSFARIMANTFLGGVPDGHGVYHKNGMKSECALYNLIVLPRKRIGEITGPRCAKRVVMKIDAQGEAIEFYRSTRQAGEANHMSYQAVLDRIHGRVKRPFELNGFTFQYEE